MGGWGYPHSWNYPPKGFPPFNGIHLNPQPDVLLTQKYASDCLPRAPNWKYSLSTIDITVLMLILFWSDLTTFYEVLPVFLSTTIFKSLILFTHLEYVLDFIVHWCHGVIEPYPFYVQPHSSFIPCEQASLIVYTCFCSPCQHVGYNEIFHPKFFSPQA